MPVAESESDEESEEPQQEIEIVDEVGASVHKSDGTLGTQSMGKKTSMGIGSKLSKRSKGDNVRGSAHLDVSDHNIGGS